MTPKEKQKQLLIDIMEADAKDGLYKHKTAVEWLIEQYNLYRPGQMPRTTFKKVCEQAKQMEKEQHGTTWDKAIDAHEKRGHVIARSWCDFDEYYNETYKK